MANHSEAQLPSWGPLRMKNSSRWWSTSMSTPGHGHFTGELEGSNLMMAAADCIILYLYVRLDCDYDLTMTDHQGIKVCLLGAKVSYSCRCCKVFAQWFNKLRLTKVYISWSTSRNSDIHTKTLRSWRKRSKQHQEKWKNVTCSINESMVFPTRTTCRLFTTSADGWVYCNCPLARPGGKSARRECAGYLPCPHPLLGMQVESWNILHISLIFWEFFWS